ncbi:hypothetical protein [Shewanella phaeophyticola]|uniref:Lipoprotein n=1 Tax=Shewanella phaeophyticola TaxID=2978345 RepID=A0ABT2P3G0_9GAMM|nr:hypothetical protein [Shewanella sp. KJ10-1]MCT8987182.1 hypothetical protein [Shewanella sp. KJ10-1]
MSTSSYASSVLIIVSGMLLSGCFSSGQTDYNQQAKRVQFE